MAAMIPMMPTAISNSSSVNPLPSRRWTIADLRQHNDTKRYAYVVILDTVRGFMDENGIRGPLLAAVSGGIDSTALLVALAKLGVEFEVAHVNHHLRGDESDGDERFVRDLCARYGTRFHVADGRLDPLEVQRAGVETAARKIRYERLQQIRLQTGAT